MPASWTSASGRATRNPRALLGQMLDGHRLCLPPRCFALGCATMCRHIVLTSCRRGGALVDATRHKPKALRDGSQTRPATLRGGARCGARHKLGAAHPASRQGPRLRGTTRACARALKTNLGSP